MGTPSKRSSASRPVLYDWNMSDVVKDVITGRPLKRVCPLNKKACTVQELDDYMYWSVKDDEGTV